MPVSDEKGYVILATGPDSAKYIDCARALAKSIRYWQPHSKICLIANTDYQHEVFDYVVGLPHGDFSEQYQSRYANDWQVFWASPFRQTIKLEADMVLTGSIDHWWTMLEKRDVVIAKGCKNFYGQPSTNRYYRRIFDHNSLPDVYNAITYWRVSKLAQDFFSQVGNIFAQWDQYRRCLKYADKNVEADTDLVYALAAKLIGTENVTLPDVCDYPGFVHLKPEHNHCTTNCVDQLIWEFDQGMLKLNTVMQQYPVHYHKKSFYKHVETHYDKLLESSRTV